MHQTFAQEFGHLWCGEYRCERKRNVGIPTRTLDRFSAKPGRGKGCIIHEPVVGQWRGGVVSNGGCDVCTKVRKNLRNCGKRRTGIQSRWDNVEHVCSGCASTLGAPAKSPPGRPETSVCPSAGIHSGIHRQHNNGLTGLNLIARVFQRDCCGFVNLGAYCSKETRPNPRFSEAL